MATQTTLIRDISLLFSDRSLFDKVPQIGDLFKHLTLTGFEEEWTADTVKLTSRARLDTSFTFELFGFEVGFGDPAEDTTEVKLTIELNSEPVVTAIGVLLVTAKLATAEEAAGASKSLGFKQMNSQDIENARQEFEASNNERPDIGDIRVELSGLTARIMLPEETFQVGEVEKDEDEGKVVGIKAHPNNPPAAIELGEVTLYADTEEGTGINIDKPNAVSTPPLLFRDTEVGLILRKLTPDLSTKSTPEPVVSRGGYDTSWRGLYIGELTVWGLNHWLPFLPGEIDSRDAGESNAGGTALTFSDWIIDRRGFSGKITLDLPEDHPDNAAAVWKLDRMGLVFDRGWVPESLSATVDLALTEFSDGLDVISSDGDVTLEAELRYNPDQQQPVARFGFDLVARAASEGPLLDLRGENLGDARNAVYTALAGLAFAGGEGPTLFVGALAAMEAADMLTTNRLVIEKLSFTYGFEQTGAEGLWKRVLSTQLDLVTEFTLALEEANINTPLGVKTNGVTIDYITNHARLEDAGVSVEPVTVDWSMDDVAVSLQADADIGNTITITDVELRTEGKEFLIELGISTEGDGAAVLTGVPNAIIIAVDSTRERGDRVQVRLGGDIPITLLVPGVLYGRGRIQTGEDVDLPAPGDDLESWNKKMRGSLSGYLIGNGTAQTLADHKKRSSYMLGLDLGLLYAERTDGMTTVVLTITATFNPGLPLGASGAAIYGIGLVYAQNAQPKFPSTGDYAGWYMNEPPEYSTGAAKWVPAEDEWGFGASTVLGSAPDNAKSWNAKVGLMLLLPGPVIMLTGKGNTFSKKPGLGSTSGDPPFAAVIVLDLEENILEVDLDIRLSVPEKDGAPNLLTANIPAEVFVDLEDASDFHLYMGQYAPEARATAKALGMLDLSSYLMLDGSVIEGLPTVDPLPGLALALGGEAKVEWGLKSSVLKCYWYAAAGFHLGVSMVDPPLLVGLIELEGGMVVKVFGFGFDLGILARLAGKAPEPFQLKGKIEVNLDLPWPLDDIQATLPITFGGDEDQLPPPPDPLVDLQLRPRRSREARSLRDAEGIPEVPVDPVFVVSFDAPMNSRDELGSFKDIKADEAGEVWKVVTTEKAEKSGVEKRHRLGYRYEITGCMLKEVVTDHRVSSAPATWAALEDATSASGGQPARKDLLLFTHEATYLNRTVGVGGRLSERQLDGWDPCRQKKVQPERSYDATGLEAGDDLAEPQRLTLEHRDKPGDPPVWVRVAAAGPSAISRLADARIVPGRVVKPPFEPSQSPRKCLQHSRVLGIPQFIAPPTSPETHETQRVELSLQVANDVAVSYSKPPGERPVDSLVDPLDVILPAHERAELSLLVADDVTVTAVGVVDGMPVTEALELNPIGSGFPLQGVIERVAENDSKRWRFYACEPPRPVDAVRLFAIRPQGLRHVPDALDAMAASVLSVQVHYEQTARGSGNAEREKLTRVMNDLVQAKLRGKDLEMLKPDTEYKLSIQWRAWHAEQWANDPVKPLSNDRPFHEVTPRTDNGDAVFHFRTAASPPSDLRGTDEPDKTREDWDVYPTPDGSVPHYTEDPMEVLFRSDRTLAEYTAHSQQLALRLSHEPGSGEPETNGASGEQFERVNAVPRPAKDLPSEKAAWRQKLEKLHCVDAQVTELWREAVAPISSTLKANARYRAALHSVGKSADLSNIAWGEPVYAWRFRTSRWKNPGDHLAAHAVIDELTEALENPANLRTAASDAVTPETTVKTSVTDGSGTVTAAMTVDDSELDRILFDTARLPPRRPPASPEAVRVWRWDPETDDTRPAALMLDGPEPLARDDTVIVFRQDGSEITGHLLAGKSRARLLFMPDGGQLVTGGSIDIALHRQKTTDEQRTKTIYTASIPMPSRPPVLASDKGTL